MRTKKIVSFVLTSIICMSSVGVYGMNDSLPSSATLDQIAGLGRDRAGVMATLTRTPTQTVSPTLPPTTSEVKRTNLRMTIFSEEIPLEQEAVLEVGEKGLFLPLRKTGEALGYEVKWDNAERAALLQKGKETVIIRSGSRECTWGTVSRQLSSKPLVIAGRMYVPADFITSNSELAMATGQQGISIDKIDIQGMKVITGEVGKIVVKEQSLSFEVGDSKGIKTLLYLNDSTRIVNYSTGEPMEKENVKQGVKAIFSFMPAEDDANAENLLISVEIVEKP